MLVVSNFDFDGGGDFILILMEIMEEFECWWWWKKINAPSGDLTLDFDDAGGRVGMEVVEEFEWMWWKCECWDG
ncbi:uncharacterized protein J8A68_005657 [[Candida] subhashii]|uniref:Uncharacterized protein n=1 Tax=[Candida] subhashii TaxID=561895 RepID=A0A8J5QFW0_9ASCO|nr:uncharacterized protein J8A68_005657 [[Candida] subhashii]KAG7660840.1 hypothetical protein J8A68_005657 [[Candida] subhashii]